MDILTIILFRLVQSEFIDYIVYLLNTIEAHSEVCTHVLCCVGQEREPITSIDFINEK